MPTGEVSFPRIFRKTRFCRYFPGCVRGDACPFAHSFDELREQPDLKKTKLCKMWLQNRCPLECNRCPFAHGRRNLSRLAAAEAWHQNPDAQEIPGASRGVSGLPTGTATDARPLVAAGRVVDTTDKSVEAIQAYWQGEIHRLNGVETASHRDSLVSAAAFQAALLKVSPSRYED